MIPKNLKLKDWIRIGTRDAVVCNINEDSNQIEVVYLDRNRAINENAHFINGHWEFVIKGPTGGYADKYPRLTEYVSILRSKK